MDDQAVCKLTFFELFDKGTWSENGSSRDKEDGSGRGIREYFYGYSKSNDPEKIIIKGRSFNKCVFDDLDCGRIIVPVPCYFKLEYSGKDEIKKDLEFTLPSIKNPLFFGGCSPVRLDEDMGAPDMQPLHNSLPDQEVRSFWATTSSDFIVKILFERMPNLECVHVNTKTGNFYSYVFKKMIIWKLSQ